MQQIIKKTVQNLIKNNMKPFVVDKKDDILPLLKTLIPKGATVGVGGSVTLDEVGVIDFLRSGDYDFYDRYKQGLTREQAVKIMKQALTADCFITSSNAVTEGGALYNVDGNGNRVAAFVYGPDSVIVIIGANKIVENVDTAIKRVKQIAAPNNCKRLNVPSPCSKTGQCVSLAGENPEMCDGCSIDGRICCSYLVSGFQRHKDRIKVIICKENMGY